MKRKLRIVLVIFSCMCLLKTNAQPFLTFNPDFNVGVPFFSVPIPMGSYYSHVVSVINKGTTSFSGDLYINITIDTGAPNPITRIVSGPRAVNILLPGDTLLFTYLEYYSLNKGYKYGLNKVEIKVTSIMQPTFVTTDSLLESVTIIHPVSVKEQLISKKAFLIYPTNVKSMLNIKELKENVVATKNTIYDLNGQIVYQNKSRDVINVDYLSKGMYILTIDVEGGKQLQYKIMKN